VVIYLEQPAWAAMTGFVAQAERTGVPVCLANPWWTFMVTSQFICTPSEVANGANFIFLPTGTPVRHTVARLESAIIATYFPQPGHSS
jgi:hypothetical protein